MEKITIRHGDGGYYTNQLIQDLFMARYGNPTLQMLEDGACLQLPSTNIAFTTDSFVVNPLFFPGGDIGTLAVCGTVNDLVASFAEPMYLSVGFVIEEGFALDDLKKIAESMQRILNQVGVEIVAGDTKVVEKGACTGVYINTSGIGMVQQPNAHDLARTIQPGDKIIVTGDVARHGTVIAMKRYRMNLKSQMESDCMPLNPLLPLIKPIQRQVKKMTDPTRGGLVTALHGLCASYQLSIQIQEAAVPIREDVLAVNQLLGFDPLYMACEGCMVMVVEGKGAEEVLHILRRQYPQACIIGEVTNPESAHLVLMETAMGGIRILPEMKQHMLPRIC